MTPHEMRDKLNQVSPAFCAAKWLQVTLHLQTGITHSCHHPIPHKIPLSELKDNPSALHNTQFKKKQREMMLNGERPPECQYCWNIEDSPGENLSDRTLKSNEAWAANRIDHLKGLPAQANISPTYLEVSFSNTCNFKCSYCSPDISSKWLEEIKQFGGYPTSESFNDLENFKLADRIPYGFDEPNPYVDAFWQWWPEVSSSLRVFRVTGGEPLLARSTFRVFEHLANHPNLDLEFAVNSNLGVPQGLIEKLADHIEDMLGLGPDGQRKVKSFTLFTSVETHGEQAEYIRTGLKYEEFIKNIEYLLGRIPSLQVVIMCTTNAMSVVGMKGLLTRVAQLKKNFFDERRYGPAVTLDVTYLREPNFQSIKILPIRYKSYFIEALSVMSELSEDRQGPFLGFSQHEISKMQRLADYMDVPCDEKELRTRRADFYFFIKEYDLRRGLNFKNTFSEMNDFLNECGRDAIEVWRDVTFRQPEP